MEKAADLKDANCDALMASSPLINDSVVSTKTYPIRWVVLLVFSLQLAMGNVLWVSMSPIDVILTCYYDINLFWTNALTWVFMLVYVLLFIPAAWFLNVMGIRVAVIVSGCFNVIGTWLRYAGSDPGLFPLLMAGQTVASISNLLLWTGPSFLSSVWFSPSERAISTAIAGAMAPQIGLLLGMPVAAFVVHDPNTFTICNTTYPIPRSSPAFLDWQEGIHQKLVIYLLSQAIAASILLPITFCVPSAPPIPPSVSEVEKKDFKKLSAFRSLFELYKNIHFVLLSIVFTILVAVSGTLTTSIEEILVNSGYSKYQQTVGYAGIIAPALSIGSILLGSLWLAYSKTYYFTAVVITAGSSVSLIGFSLAVQFNLNFYLACAFYGLLTAFVMAFQAVGYEYAVEITYPRPESDSAGLPNAASQLLNIVLLNVVVAMTRDHLAVYSSWIMTCLVVLSTIIMVFIRPELKRQKVESFDTPSQFKKRWSWKRGSYGVSKLKT